MKKTKFLQKTEVALENEVGIKKQGSNPIPAPRKYLESSSNNSHGVATNNTLEDLCEVNITLPDTTETIQLRKPNEVYYEIYQAALKKAKHMRNVAPRCIFRS